VISQRDPLRQAVQQQGDASEQERSIYAETGMWNSEVCSGVWANQGALVFTLLKLITGARAELQSKRV
jgi:hypothetical protein